MTDAKGGAAPSRSRRVRLAALVGLPALTAAILVFVGPWPAARPVDLETHAPTRRAVKTLEERGARSRGGPRSLAAGWARRVPVLPPGVPLAGYSDRAGRPSTGVDDAVDVEALVVSDGRDHAALAASDLLIVPPRVARRVRRLVAERTPLAPASLLLNASHTHAGPGGFAPGWLARQSAGPFDPEVEAALVEAFAGAIVAAWEAREPARAGHVTRPVPEWVRNRARPEAPVDAELQLTVLEQEDGDRLLVTCYAAHPTLLPPAQMRLSAAYPGFLERALESATGDEAFFLSGAVGSMAPVATDGAPIEQSRRLGEALARRAVAALPDVRLSGELDVAWTATAYSAPALQVRPRAGLRWSPFLVRALGVEPEGRLTAIRIGDLVVAGFPGDLSGEIAVELKSRARRRGLELWTTSFNGAYLGYISPDRYYASASSGGPAGYEMYTMSWGGSQQEAQLTLLVEAALGALEPPAQGRGRP